MKKHITYKEINTFKIIMFCDSLRISATAHHCKIWAFSWVCHLPFETSPKMFAFRALSCCSVTKLCPALCDSGLQHAQLPSSSASSGVCSSLCPLSQWCHPTISSSVAPFSSCPHHQSFPASESFPQSWLFASGGQNNISKSPDEIFKTYKWYRDPC